MKSKQIICAFCGAMLALEALAAHGREHIEPGEPRQRIVAPQVAAITTGSTITPSSGTLTFSGSPLTTLRSG